LILVNQTCGQSAMMGFILPIEARIMLKKILVPTDGSDLSAKAIVGAVEIARQCGAKLVGMTVTDPYPKSKISGYSSGETFLQYETRVKTEAIERLAILVDLARGAGVVAETEVRSSPAPYEAIIAAATERGCDSIVMASHGRRGLSALLLGSETHKVLTHSTIPVLVFR
jgi:nucleotide-binding universal stress UspA family protein